MIFSCFYSPWKMIIQYCDKWLYHEFRCVERDWVRTNTVFSPKKLSFFDVSFDFSQFPTFRYLIHPTRRRTLFLTRCNTITESIFFVFLLGARPYIFGTGMWCICIHVLVGININVEFLIYPFMCMRVVYIKMRSYRLLFNLPGWNRIRNLFISINHWQFNLLCQIVYVFTVFISYTFNMRKINKCAITIFILFIKWPDYLNWMKMVNKNSIMQKLLILHGNITTSM